MPKVFEKKAGVGPGEDLFRGSVDPTKVYLSWTAPSRPYRKRDRSYYTTIGIIVLLLVFIALLAHELLLIGVLISLCFVTYVLAFVPPQDVNYKISGQGVTIGDHFYFWGDMNSFWFSRKEGQEILNILTYLRFPAQLMILIGDRKEEEVKKILAKFLPFHEIAPKSFIDRWAETLQKSFPLENRHK